MLTSTVKQWIRDVLWLLDQETYLMEEETTLNDLSPDGHVERLWTQPTPITKEELCRRFNIESRHDPSTYLPKEEPQRGGTRYYQSLGTDNPC